VTDLGELQQAAKTGDARAQYELGARLLVGREAPVAPQEGMALLSAAGMQNHSDALQLTAVLVSLGIGAPQSWNDAIALVRRAAALGDQRAEGQLKVIGEDLQAWFRPPRLGYQFNGPRIATLEGLISLQACVWIIDRARPALSRAAVKNPAHGSGDVLSYRSNTGTGLSLIDTDLVVQLTHMRIAAALGLPLAHQEPSNILHYDTGEEYRPHFDFINPDIPQFARELEALGQRLATCLIYLNDDYEAGETAFPRLGWSFKGGAGDALLFWNVTPDGKPDPLTLHAGTPPSRGEKWLFSKWVRDRPLPLI
jgi:prolyl 4-hydroxylase